MEVPTSLPARLEQLTLLPSKFQAPTSQSPSGTPCRWPVSKGETRASDTRPRTRARLEKVTPRPVTEFSPSERLSHRGRPGLVGTRALAGDRPGQ